MRFEKFKGLGFMIFRVVGFGFDVVWLFRGRGLTV